MAPHIPTGIVSVSTSSVTGTYKDLADFGFVVDAHPDVFAWPSLTRPTAQIPGQLASVPLATRPTGALREFRVGGTVVGATLAAALANARNLIGWCARAVAVKTAHDASTFLQVALGNVTAEPLLPLAGSLFGVAVTLTFQATTDPLWRATSLTTNNLTTALTEQALGTAPVAPVIRLTGALTDPTITYADSSGTTVTTLALTLTLPGASDYVEIDSAARTVVKSVSSVLSDAIDTISGGDFPVLDPADSDTVTPVWCQLKYAIGGGSVSAATAAYRKAYY